MKRLFLSLIVLLPVALSCSEKKTTESRTDVLREKVMAIHDEVMPKMNDLHKLKKQLEEEIKNSPDLVAERKEQIENQLKQVNEASEGMMQWMRQFNPEDFKADKEEYLKYLNEELEKVSKVKEDMLKALEEKE